MQAQEIKLYTPEEYLALEEAAEFKSEYHDGEIVPMTGGSLNHNRIMLSVAAFLKYALRGKGAEAFSGDVRLWIPKFRRFTYPDVMVIQGEPVLYANRTDTICNPSLIIEVLSKSTQDYDQGDKFKYYRSIPELKEYILINQYEVDVQRYIKQENGLWLFQAYESVTETLRFESAGVEMSIADLYESVAF